MTTAKIAISLPKDLLKAIEKERLARGESRSEFLRHAVEDMLRRKKEKELSQQYIRGYQRFPETEDEKALYDIAAVWAAEDNPWEEDEQL